MLEKAAVMLDAHYCVLYTLFYASDMHTISLWQDLSRPLNFKLLLSTTLHQYFVNLCLFESVDGDPGFVGADCPCMCTLYADCENYGASASAPLEKAPGMLIWPHP